MRAYDLEILAHPPQRRDPDNCGWVFGLPPGIAPAQWPLDPVTGYPLVHGFTLLLPPDHRVHGPEVVALSFFATAADQNDGGADETPGVRAALTGTGPQPSSPLLARFWERAQAAHPRTTRMQDVLGYEYAVVLLTASEFDGPFCHPPEPLALPGSEAPRWLELGSALAYHGQYEAWPGDAKAAAEQRLTQSFGELPRPGLDWCRALRWTPRANDPNAGMPPREYPANAGSYVLPYYWQDGIVTVDNYRTHDWVGGHKPNHIGGTMRPMQGIPEFSPHYIEFEEDFGGYNFGGGNAQLDFRDMKFDWACD